MRAAHDPTMAVVLGGGQVGGAGGLGNPDPIACYLSSCPGPCSALWGPLHAKPQVSDLQPRAGAAGPPGCLGEGLVPPLQTGARSPHPCPGT